MHRTLLPFSPIRWALLNGRFPDDLAGITQQSLRIFQVNPSMYDTPGLQGPAKRAELIVKLGYWLAVGRLSAPEFRAWLERIPPVDNCDWDVDLVPRRPGSVLPGVLKMGPALAPLADSFAQEA